MKVRTSTHGGRIYYDLEDGKAGDLPDLNYTMVALGDTSYDEFCGCGRKVDKHLETAERKILLRTLGTRYLLRG